VFVSQLAFNQVCRGADPNTLEAGDQANAAALSGWKTKEFGGASGPDEGLNQLVFDDTDQQLRVQLATTQNATRLNLGHLIYQARYGDTRHRRSFRGLGFELRTDAYVTYRGDRGLNRPGFWMLGPTTEINKKALIQEVVDKQKQHDYLMAKARDTQNPGVKRNLETHARFYELNKFELRVWFANQAQPGSLPVFTDADALELRRRAGLLTQVTLKLMGTATRREASGHGRYRRIFDDS
jgi:hypothetical protein